jgi:hypothetical protein
MSDFSPPKRPGRLCGPPNLLFIRYCGSCRGIKRPGRYVAQSHLSSAEAKSEWSYRPTSSPLHALWRVGGQLYFDLLSQ